MPARQYIQHHIPVRLTTNLVWLMQRLLIAFAILLSIVFMLTNMLEMDNALAGLINFRVEKTFTAWFPTVQLFCIGLVILSCTSRPDSNQITSIWFLRLIGFVFIVNMGYVGYGVPVADRNSFGFSGAARGK